MLKPLFLLISVLATVFFISGAQFIHSAVAQPVFSIEKQSPRYLAQIEVNTARELEKLLNRAARLFESGGFQIGRDEPVMFVLHGPEAKALLRENYSENKVVVDLAARLTAFKVVDIKVCEAWMGSEGIVQSRLPPFVGTVPIGLAEKQRLMDEENYVYF